MNAEGRRALQMLADERNTTINALASDALNDLLKKRAKPAVVKNPLIDDET